MKKTKLFVLLVVMLIAGAIMGFFVEKELNKDANIGIPVTTLEVGKTYWSGGDWFNNLGNWHGYLGMEDWNYMKFHILEMESLVQEMPLWIDGVRNKHYEDVFQIPSDFKVVDSIVRERENLEPYTAWVIEELK